MKNAYDLVSEFYGLKRAERTTLPYMNHIREGIDIIDILQPSQEIELLKNAYCLHPLVQDVKNLEETILYLTQWAHGSVCNSWELQLALEYRSLANAYLCRPETVNYQDATLKLLLKEYSDLVKVLLLVDKIQNYKDFRLFHSHTHLRRVELTTYFDRWIRVLTDDEGVRKLCTPNNIEAAKRYGR